MINGRGAVHFSRSSSDGSGGQFLEMYNNPQWTNNTGVGFDYNPFTSKQTAAATTAANSEFTILLVARTSQSKTDTGEMGIVRLSEADGTLRMCRKRALSRAKEPYRGQKSPTEEPY